MLPEFNPLTNKYSKLTTYYRNIYFACCRLICKLDIEWGKFEHHSLSPTSADDFIWTGSMNSFPLKNPSTSPFLELIKDQFLVDKAGSRIMGYPNQNFIRPWRKARNPPSKEKLTRFPTTVSFNMQLWPQGLPVIKQNGHCAFLFDKLLAPPLSRGLTKKIL